jgi:hypothetical protein
MDQIAKYPKHERAQLLKTGIAEQALKQIDLLEHVIYHKMIFFRSAWAHYETARPGSFRLIPHETRMPILRQDYERMKIMIFGEVPKWDEIIKKLKKLEHQINSL